MALRNSLFVFIAMLSGQSAQAFHGHRREAAVTFVRPALTTLDPAWQLELRHRPQWRSFLSTHGLWWAEFNEANGMPHRAYGAPIGTSGTDPVSRATHFLTHGLAMYDLPMDDLSVIAVYPTEKHTYVHFAQMHNGLRVLTSRVMVKLDVQGRVIAFGTDVYPTIEVPLHPSVTESAVIASASLGLHGIGSVDLAPGLFVLPVPVHRSVEHHLVRELVVHTSEDGVPSQWKCWVDAHTTELLYRQDKVMHHAPPASVGAELTLSGNVYTENPFVPASMQPLSYARVVVNGSAQYLDSQGYLNTGTGGPVSATVYLNGSWSNVQTNSVTPSFGITLQEGTNTLSFDQDANIRERSAYYHVNIVHDHMKTWLPGFEELDFALATNVDIAGTCNAFYDGGSINFYEEGSGCQSYAQVGEVVYHEYGHAINDRFYSVLGGNFENGAMNEGYADVWGFTITEDPVLADGSSLTDPDDFIRRYDQDRKVYPEDIVGEVHADGEIIAGAWWDTYVLLGSDINTLMALFVEAYPGMQADTPNGNEGAAFRDVLLDVLQADDDDGDLTNGTPNDAAIIEAFAMHGITLLTNAELLHDNPESAQEDVGIELDAQLIMDFDFLPFLQDVVLYYRVNNDPTWNQLVMIDNGGNDYHASIPAQPRGTVVAYYIGMEDIFEHLTGVLPVQAADPEPNVPYFVLVGYRLEGTEDLDGMHQLGAWQTGRPGDNATSGVWVDGVPVASYVDPAFPASLVQTGEQHTPGGAACFVTGNASSDQSPMGSRDVDEGTTTLMSAPMDLSAFTIPTLSYWRWYVNDPPSGPNPASDRWQVQITNDGNTWVPIEDTRVTDRSWRRVAFRVGDHVTPNGSVRIRFLASDSLRPGDYLDGASIVEAAVDDIQLWDQAWGVGVEEGTHDLGIHVYPDPAIEVLNVRMDIDGALLLGMRVLDPTGRLVDELSVSGMSGKEIVMLNVADYGAGSYVLQVITDRGRDGERFFVLR